MRGIWRAVINMLITLLINVNMFAYAGFIPMPESGLTDRYVWVVLGLAFIFINFEEE